MNTMKTPYAITTIPAMMFFISGDVSPNVIFKSVFHPDIVFDIKKVSADKVNVTIYVSDSDVGNAINIFAKYATDIKVSLGFDKDRPEEFTCSSKAADRSNVIYEFMLDAEDGKVFASDFEDWSIFQ